MNKIWLLIGLLLIVASLVYLNQPKLPSGTSSQNPIAVLCETTKGPLRILVMPAWSPLGAERFLQLVEDGFFTEMPFFRCVKDFVCQVGAKTAGLTKPYSAISDDPKRFEFSPLKRGQLSFAGFAANSRTNHIFINLGSAPTLGTQSWETPFAYLDETTLNATASKLTTQYGDMPPWGNGPDAALIEAASGKEYLKTKYPQLDYIKYCARDKTNNY